MTTATAAITAALACGAAMFTILERWFGGRRPRTPNSPPEKIKEYIGRGRQYLVYIGVPCPRPCEWVRVEAIEGTDVVCDGGQRHALAEVRSCLIAYPNGEILDATRAFGPFPEGLRMLEPGRAVRRDVLEPAELAEGARWMTVTHGKPRPGSSGKLVYATSLTNVGSEPVQVLRFAGYAMIGGEWRLHTVSGSYFSAEQFRAWYGLGDAHWIEPGQTVSDPDNYGGPHALWAYFCRTKSGMEFVTGAEAE